MRIILFNGPPSCGKDTAARAVYQDLGNRCVFERFSMPIKRAFAATYSAAINQYGEVHYWENVKDEPSDLLGGKTYRQWQIDFSEKFMKPMYGEYVFPTLAGIRIAQYFQEDTVVIPDCGFQVEVEKFAELMPGQCYLIRIHREGFDFSKDSRQYVVSNGKFFQCDVHNVGTAEDLRRSVVGIVRGLK